MTPTRSAWLMTTALVLTPAVASAQSQSQDIDIDEILVSASPLAKSELDLVEGSTVLTGDALKDAVSASLGETLRGETGITSTFFGPISSRPIIRGQGGDRIRILTNGLDPVDASVESVDHQIALDPGLADRIEVLRGPNTLRYGSNAVGGVINVLDGRIARTTPDAPLSGTATVSYGTNAEDLYLRGGVNGYVGNGLVVSVDGSYRDTSDYEINGFANEEAEEEGIEGFVENSASETYSIGGGLSYVFEAGHFGISAEHFDSRYGVPAEHEHGHEEDEDHDEDHAEEEEEEEIISIDLKRTRVDLDGEYRDLGPWFEKATFQFGYGDYEHTEFEGEETGTLFANEAWEARAELVHAPIGLFTGAFGIQFNSRDFSAIGEEAFVPPTETDKWSLFAVERATVGQVTFTGGVRFESTESESPTTGITRSFDTLSGAGGLVWQPTNTIALGLNTSYTERAPNSTELFANGPHLATQQFEIGDPTLESEAAWQSEVSFEVDEARWGGKLNVFRTEYDDYIFERQTGAEEDELPVFQFTQVDATFIGFEAEGRVTFIADGPFTLSADSALSYVRAQDKTNDDPLPRIPPVTFTAGLDAGYERFTARFELEGATRADRLAPLETETGGYVFINLGASYRPFEDRDVRFSLQAKNLGDRFARPHTSFIKDLTPYPGRDIRFAVTAGF